ncbi:MAG: PAS domain S-box protein [Candidatus Electryoneaceae bacterium]|nr:PAS domain S-box protein [Candidatus Electryoneaceae bacterium]
MIKTSPLQTATIQYAIYGALFGLSFPIIGTVLIIITHNLPLSFAGIISAQSFAAPLLYIIDTAPFFLGLFALVAGRHQDALKESAKDTRLAQDTITDSAQDAIIMMDHEGIISFWNPAAIRIFGYTQEEANGRNLHRLLTPERFYQAHQNGFESFKRTGQGAAIGKTLELAALHKDGHEFPIAISLSSFQKNGNWQAVGIIRDISESKETEAKLTKSEEQYRAIFESFQDIYYRADLKGCLTLISPSVRQYGYEPEEIIGRSVTSFYNNPSEREPLIEQLIKDGVVKDYALQLKYKDGTVVDT